MRELDASEDRDGEDEKVGIGFNSCPKRGGPDESGRARWRAMRAVVYFPGGIKCLIATSSGMSSTVSKRSSVSPVK